MMSGASAAAPAPAEKKTKKTVKKTESVKREANDSDSSASGPSSTSPRKKTKVSAKTATKAQVKEEPSSSLADPSPASPSLGSAPASTKKSSAAVSGLLDRPTLARPASPSIGIDLVTSSQTLREKDIQPSKLNFGFLGLGIMGYSFILHLQYSFLHVLEYVLKIRTNNKDKKHDIKRARCLSHYLSIVI